MWVMLPLFGPSRIWACLVWIVKRNLRLMGRFLDPSYWFTCHLADKNLSSLMFLSQRNYLFLDSYALLVHLWREYHLTCIFSSPIVATTTAKSIRLWSLFTTLCGALFGGRSCLYQSIQDKELPQWICKRAWFALQCYSSKFFNFCCLPQF